MGILSKLFGSSNESTVVVETPPCPHATLSARWDSVDDMGDESKATSFVCEACNQTFTLAEAQTLRTSIADRMNSDLAGLQQVSAEAERKAS